MITQPRKKAVVARCGPPRAIFPSTLVHRPSPRYVNIILLMYFEAFYDSTPLPPGLRDNFVFRSRKNKCYGLGAILIGDRWGLAVGQGIANAMVNMDMPGAIRAPIGNILMATVVGPEKESFHTSSTVFEQIEKSNLLAFPGRDGLLEWDDGFPLQA